MQIVCTDMSSHILQAYQIFNATEIGLRKIVFNKKNNAVRLFTDSGSATRQCQY